MLYACEWYEEKRKGLARRFLREVYARFNRIAKNPELYQIHAHDGGHGTKIIWQKKFAKGVRRKVNPIVQEFLKGKVGLGYFTEPRLVLPLYLEMKRILTDGSFSAANLEKGLAVLMRKDGPLKKVKIDTQLHYVTSL